MQRSMNKARLMLFALLSLSLIVCSTANEAIAFESKIRRRLEDISPTLSAASATPSVLPTSSPSVYPSSGPSVTASVSPSRAPSLAPSAGPSVTASAQPSRQDSNTPSVTVSYSPSSAPSTGPSDEPSSSPSITGSGSPSNGPSTGPSSSPSITMEPSNLPSFKPSVSIGPSVTGSNKPSSGPSTVPSTSSIPSPSPTSSSSPSVTPSTSNMPSDEHSPLPSFLPSHVPSVLPSLSPSTSSGPSNIPSSAPSFSKKDFLTSEITMVLKGLESRLEGSEETDFWRKSVTNYIGIYWSNHTGSPIEEFLVLDTSILKQGFSASRRGLAHKSGKTRNLKGPFSQEIFFVQNYRYRAADGSTVPSAMYLKPLNAPGFLPFLKKGDITNTYEAVTSITVEEIVNPSTPTSSPIIPSIQPSVITEKYNGNDTDFRLIVIILGVILGVIGLCSIALIVWRSHYFRRTPADEINEDDSSASSVAADVAGGSITPTRGNIPRASPKEIIKESDDRPDAQDPMLAKNSLAFLDDDISDLGSQEISSPEKIDLSIPTTENKDNDVEEDDPQFNVDGGDDDSEINDSDSMLSFDVYSNGSDDIGSDEFMVVPKGSPRPVKNPRFDDSGEGKAKKPQTQVENLVISGAPLSGSKEDGPKIGSTKIIEGKGELKGVKLLAVGDIDEVSSPHSTFSA